jgi:hypothetical protein
MISAIRLLCEAYTERDAGLGVVVRSAPHNHYSLDRVLEAWSLLREACGLDVVDNVQED